MEEILAKLMTNLVTLVGTFDGKPIDMRDTIYSLTVGAIYTLLTGKLLHADSELMETFKTLERSFISSLAIGESIELDIFPWLRYFGHPTYLKLKKALAMKIKLWNELWSDSLKTYETDKPECMLHAMADLINKSSSSYQPEMNENFLKGIFLDFIIAGITTTTTSAYALLNILLHNPQVVINLQHEIDKVTNSSRRPTISDKENMPYTMAVIYELMRYISIAPLSGRRTLEETTLAGFKIPLRTNVYLHYWAVHHDEEFWGDPWIFRPERFLDANDKLIAADHPNRKRLLAFADGMRVCVGEVFALRRLFIFITYIVQSFNLLPDDFNNLTSCDPRTYTTGLVLYPPSFRMRLVRKKCATSEIV